MQESEDAQNEQFTYADARQKNGRTFADPPGGGFRISPFLRSKSRIFIPLFFRPSPSPGEFLPHPICPNFLRSN
jgi:hypothetical protein